MRVLALGGSMLVLALSAAQAAAASTVETDCANLATTLTAATPGETIVLSGLCSTPNANFVLPETAGLTIEGASTGVNGFDGTGAGGGALASPSEGVDGLTLRNLTFENYEAAGGAFIKAAKAATHPFAFLHDTFLHNTTTDHGGGLAVIVVEPGTCAFTGAGPPVTLAESSFRENTATFQAGGGAYIDLECKAGSISASVTGNVFTGNRVASNDEALEGGGSVRRARSCDQRRCSVPTRPAGQPVRRERDRKHGGRRAPCRGRRRVHRRRRRDEPRRPLHRQPDRRRQVLDEGQRGRRLRVARPRRMHAHPRCDVQRDQPRGRGEHDRRSERHGAGWRGRRRVRRVQTGRRRLPPDARQRDHLG